jgi:probable HAF family extracellular repeat protein
MRPATPVRLCRSAIATLSVSLFTTFTTSCSSPQHPMEPGRPELAVASAVALTDLGTLGGSHSEALAINVRGQVAGFSTTATGERHAFFWDGGAMRDLGAFAGGTFGSPFIALNDAGQVAFTSLVASGETHAVLWDGTTVRDLGTLGGDYSEATAINATGTVVGFSRIVAGGFDFHAVVWDHGALRDLGLGRALAINSRGQVTGFGASHAFLWNGTTLLDLGTLGGGTSMGTIINERGQVAGFSSLASGTSHAFFWDGATMQDLGAVGGDDWPGDPSSWFSNATAFDGRGRVAGFSAGFFPAQELAFFWDGTTMHSLGTLGGADSHAMAMNNRGQVVGQAALPSSSCYNLEVGCHAFLWNGTTMLDLGSLGNGPSVALAINGRGQIAGWSSPGDLHLDAPIHAVVWTLPTTRVATAVTTGER